MSFIYNSGKCEPICSGRKKAGDEVRVGLREDKIRHLHWLCTSCLLSSWILYFPNWNVQGSKCHFKSGKVIVNPEENSL